MTKMFKKVVGLTLILSLSLIVTVMAQPMGPMGKGRGGPGQGIGQGMGPCGMVMGRGMRMGRMGGPGPMAIWKDKELLKKAGISEEQANKIRDFHFQNQRDRVKLGSDMKLKQLEMGELMDADKPDEGKIMAKAKEISALREKMFLQGVEQQLTMKKLITPEQEQKLREVMQEKHSELTPEAPDMMFGMGPEMMGPGPDFGSSLPPMPDAPEPPEGLE
jgi:Spy/CpxP family protein refolding chaperone